jgi:hypothetical protein
MFSYISGGNEFITANKFEKLTLVIQRNITPLKVNIK